MSIAHLRNCATEFIVPGMFKESPVNHASEPRTSTATGRLRANVRRDISIAFTIKLVLLVALYLACVSPAHRTRVTAEIAASTLIGQPFHEPKP